ncbi:MAG: DNA polymerase III subunit chi [Rhodospirillales bacterium]|jgi:DNA polymerase III subunit chi|nr:DNA polymerase III subunit chi [Rhodospirillaceae bacterium]MBT7770953.1 DNA polymerase III subunit chi [Rhodospirillales bacterium]MBT5035760.1 DNA polymerase III subunit chi [Rhodospirillaceae bacterium]MBT6218763.1 DNA polymerase III subunit chi [Rhodospirillaceae bacterium]MBT6363657.1 DNA polymerase III subunit chi [Rhodospirillaceae bacterium]
MTSVAFYHLQKWPLDRALPKLLEKTVEAGKRAIVMAGSDDKIEALNGLLWTYENDSWLPHGSRKDGAPEDQPVWLTTNDENPNQSQFLFLTDGASSDHVGEFERCFELFDGEDDAAVSAAREHWKTYKDAGYDLTYWQQTDRGGWEEKAGA